MKRYRVTTTDGFILHETNNRKEADAWASQQSKQLNEKIVLKRFDGDSYVVDSIVDEPETPIYNRAYVDRLFRDGMNDY